MDGEDHAIYSIMPMHMWVT